MDLYNETAINVASLLRDPIGSTRQYTLQLDSFPLDADLGATNVTGEIKLTKLPDEILTNVRASADVLIECLYCLREYEEQIHSKFSEEFRVAYDVRTGVGIQSADSDERFELNDKHELDFGEALRQELIIAIPMRRRCGDDCPGPAIVDEDDGEKIDERLAGLADLLENDETTQ
jgi:uncharacterized metal-binding protein YceD (DUF177 family)